MKKILLLIPLMLAACGGTTKEPPLAGKRIDILGEESTIEPNPAASRITMLLPDAEKNRDWAQPMANAQHLPQHMYISQEVNKAWSLRSGRVFSRVVNTPVIHAGRLFVLNSGSVVKAFSSQTGKELWEKRLPVAKGEGSDFIGGLAVAGDRSFATSPNGQVFSLSASEGEVIWDVDVGAPLRSAPTVVKDQLIVMSHDNRLFALDVRQGNLLWTHSGITETLSMASGATPAISGDTVIVPYTSGDLYALQLKDGQYVWHAALNRLNMRALGKGVQGFAASPVISGNVVVAATVDGVVAAFDLSTGRRLWKTDISTSQTPWVAGNVLFVLSEEGRLFALNLEDGEVRWISDLNSYVDADERDKPRFWSGPVLAGGRLIVVANNAFAMSLDPRTGRKLLATRIVNGFVSVRPIVAEGGLYFYTDDGRIIKFK